MDCPNSKMIGASGIPFCPSKAPVNEHHTEWSSEYYCTTCGYEHMEKYDIPRQVRRDIPPPAPRRKKPATPQQY